LHKSARPWPQTQNQICPLNLVVCEEALERKQTAQVEALRPPDQDDALRQDPLAPIVRRSMLFTPERQAPSAWIEHVPFAFWLVDVLRPATIVELGTHVGVSYSAMCQAVKSLGLSSRCFAIDTWKGDKQSGLYPEEIYDEFSKFHDARYSSFSRLVRSSFDAALPHFEEQSIDLLHIDGLHTYEAVRHDYESWLPKLSKSAIVLFHDTNVRENNFGVFRLWNEVADGHLHFNFLHGNGLGVLGLGRDYPEAVHLLFDANAHGRVGTAFREMFAYVGRSVSHMGDRDSLERALATRNRELAERTAKADALDQALSENAARLGALRAELAERESQVGRLNIALSETAAQVAPLRAIVSSLQTSSRWLVAARQFKMLLQYSAAGHSLRLGWRAVKTGSMAPLRDLQATAEIARSGLFDREWYLKSYPDVAVWGVDPLRHYVARGARDGRNPNRWFRGLEYFGRYPQAVAAGVNPFADYLRHGAADTRDRAVSATSTVVRKQFAFISGCPGDAYRYRCHHIGQVLRNIGYTADIFPVDHRPYDQLARDYDVIIAHRVPWDFDFETFVKRAGLSGAFVIYDADDLVFDPALLNRIDAYNVMTEPEREIYRDGVERYGRALALCHGVTVSTTKLLDEVRRLHPHMPGAVIRNKVSREMCRQAAETLARAPDRGGATGVTIAYFSGTATHRKDFAVCADALLGILKDFPQARLMIVGHLMLPDRFAEFGSRVETVPFVPWHDLPALYRKADINLASLEHDNEFTESKSELKYLEAALLGVPTVASDVGAYRETIVNWSNGVLCRDSAQWRHAIGKLIEDGELRRRIGNEAARCVATSGTTLGSGHVVQAEWRRLLASLSAKAAGQRTRRRASVAFVLRAPIAVTSGGYRKIFSLVNYLAHCDCDVRVYVERLAHLAAMSDAEIREYCRMYFDADPATIFVGHSDIEPADVAIATNWPTARVVNGIEQVRVRLYFVQDYEPGFYGKNQIEYHEANATYDLEFSCITIGDYLRKALEDRGRVARSIPFGLDESFHVAGRGRKLEMAGESRSLMFFSRPALPRRNFQVGVEALAAFNRKYPDARIRLYGLEERLDLPFPYDHLGRLPQSELAAQMACTDIHLSYSLTNISTVIYEAMACGCACVEADVGSVRGMVRGGEDCLLVEPTAPATFDALDRLMGDRDLRWRIAATGYSFAKELTEERMCKEFLRLVRESALLE